MATEKWRRGLAWLMVIAVVAPVIFLILAFGVLQLYHGYQNTNYAKAAFGDAVEISRVVGSKRTHGIVTAVGCTYAVIAIGARQAKALEAEGPQSLRITNTAFAKRWPQKWQSTPFPVPAMETCGDGGPAIPCCLKDFSDADRASILSGLSNQSGWYSERAGHVAFILPGQRLVGLVRYGD